MRIKRGYVQGKGITKRSGTGSHNSVERRKTWNEMT
jgi:hypothetical protein